jgi:hypothetical protein
MFKNEELHNKSEATYRFPNQSTSIIQDSIFPIS